MSTALCQFQGPGHYDHRMPALSRRADRRGDHLIVCGDGPLAYRITEELTSRYGERVTVILPDRRHNHGPQISALSRVRVLEYPELSSQAFTDADVQSARALAVVWQDDVGNLHAGLRAQELNPGAPAGAGHLQPASRRAHQDAVPGLHGAVRHGDVGAVVRGRRAGRAVPQPRPGAAAHPVRGPAGRRGGRGRGLRRDRRPRRSPAAPARHRPAGPGQPGAGYRGRDAAQSAGPPAQPGACCRRDAAAAGGGQVRAGLHGAAGGDRGRLLPASRRSLRPDRRAVPHPDGPDRVGAHQTAGHRGGEGRAGDADGGRHGLHPGDHRHRGGRPADRFGAPGAAAGQRAHHRGRARQRRHRRDRPAARPRVRRGVRGQQPERPGHPAGPPAGPAGGDRGRVPRGDAAAPPTSRPAWRWSR